MSSDVPSSTGASSHSTVHFCRSRHRGRRCTRPLDHPGLHRHRAILWAGAAADPLRCAGSGAQGRAATPLADGWPHGRALCPVCLRFVSLVNDTLAAHDTSDPAEPASEALRRRDWFNTIGW